MNMVAEALNLGPVGLAISVAVVFVAAYVRGYSGFGFSAVLMAGLSLVLPVAQVVPLSIGLEVIASIQQARGVWRDIAWRTFFILLVAAAIGNPLGIWLLVAVPAEPMRLGLLGFILLISVALLFVPRLAISQTRIGLAAAGFASGLVNGATALSGLVLALYFMVTALPAAVMRATLIAYFFATDLWAGGLLVSAGIFDAATLVRIVAALPVMALGVWLGGKRFLGTPPQSFRRLVLGLLIALSVVGLTRSLV